MSFTSIEPATSRLHRSELAVPGSNTALFEKAAGSAADIVFLDVEDAVAPDDKAQARKNIVQGLNEIDWGSKTMMVRINGLDTHYMYRDVVDIVEACPRLDMILIPKTGVAADVYAVDMMVTQIETAMKRTKRIGFEVLIETALGMANVEAIAQSSKRLEAMSFGVADYAASTRARTTVIGGVNRDSGVLTDKDAGGKRDYYWTDPWHAAQTRMMVACRAYGLRPIDGPFGDFGDADGFRAAANRAAVLGYEGKWAIHPSQIALCNEVFTSLGGRIDQGRPHHGGDGAGCPRRARRGVARRAADRLRQHPHGRGAVEEGGCHPPERLILAARRMAGRERPPRRVAVGLALLCCSSGISLAGPIPLTELRSAAYAGGLVPNTAFTPTADARAAHEPFAGVLRIAETEMRTAPSPLKSRRGARQGDRALPASGARILDRRRRSGPGHAGCHARGLLGTRAKFLGLDRSTGKGMVRAG